MSKKPFVSIIVLTWNGIKDTLLVLQDIAKLDTKGLKAETLVVDNGSTDETVKTLENYRLPNMDFRLIKTGENLGFAGGNNVGIKNALRRGADFVILLNNDVILKNNLLTALVKIAQKDPRIGLISPKMYFAKGFEFHKNRYKEEDKGKVIWYAGGVIDWENIYSSHRGVDEVDKGQYDKQVETDFANGACVLIRKEVFRKVGYLDDGFFLYWEDADFSEKAKRLGFKVVYTPRTCLWHKVSSSAGGSGSPSNDYFLVRNRFIFGMRYASFRTKIALVRDSLRLLFIGRPWQKKGARDGLLGRMGKASWAKK